MPLYLFLAIWFSFIFFETITSRKKEIFWRKELILDLSFALFNGIIFWQFWPALDQLIQQYISVPKSNLLNLCLFFQWLILFVSIDFLSWWTHRSFHTFPWLWKIHKLHHSITELNFLRVLYFNPLENIIYAVTTLLPLLFLQFDPQVFLWLAIVNAIIGYMNHANTRIRVWTWLAKIINTPQVHIWHHDESHPKKSAKNFGINLSLWDTIFGTLYVSNIDPKEIGNRKT